MNNILICENQYVLRSYLPEDAALISTWINNQENNKYFELDEEKTVNSMIKSIERITNSLNNIGLLVFYDNLPIAITEINDIDFIRKKATFELMLGDQSFSSKGHGANIISIIKDYCQNTLQLRKLTSYIFEENIKMLHLGYRSGFHDEGLLHKEAYAHGAFHNIVIQSVFLFEHEIPPKDVLSLIGNTPYIRLNPMRWELNGCDVYCKLESFNPSGSVKDRAAYNMIKVAIENGKINSNTTIIEATSGNLGISLAMVCAVYGLKLISVSPSGVIPQAKRDLYNALGGILYQTPIEYSYEGAIEYANYLGNVYDNTFIVGQFENLNNVEAHKTTAEEILRIFGSKLDVIIACLGSGGTLTGLNKYSHTERPIKYFAVEPATCTVMSDPPIVEGHYILGIGPGFIPQIFDANKMDGVITVTDEEAANGSIMLARKEGIYCGISSGAALTATLKYCKTHHNEKILVLLADNGIRYSGKKGFYNNYIYSKFQDYDLNKEISLEDFNLTIKGQKND